jgi:hypothetical protein
MFNVWSFCCIVIHIRASLWFEDCKACPLHTKTEEDDERAMREAAIHAARNEEKENKVQVDVESILRKPT